MSHFISVAGNLGSGKTTLVRSLAKELGWQIRPEVGYNITYLEDLFRDPNRWSFEAQMAFLSHKAQSIKEAIRTGFDFVVDRSIYEDIEIFAQTFADIGLLDARAYGTYETYAKFILEEMPVPVAIVYCRCSPEICENRLAGRPRPYQRLYPNSHIEHLHEKYEEWASKFDLCPLFVLDTSTYQTDNPEIIRRIVQELSTFLSGIAAQKITQPELFPTLSSVMRGEEQTQILQLVNKVHSENISRLPSHNPKRYSTLLLRHPYVYIAAPFTGAASSTTSPKSVSDAEEQKLLDVPHPHGVIPIGRYRSLLSALSKEFERLGYQSILPHRDVNRWGTKELTPKEVGQQCIRLVRDCDLFFGILGTSFGAHVEAGIALALSKPAILVSLEEEQETFMGHALRESGLAVNVIVKNLEELVALVSSASFQHILESTRQLIKQLH